MRLAALDLLAPRCLRCLDAGQDAPLHLEPGWTGEPDRIVHGILACGCGAAYPIIEGVPVLVPDLDHYLGEAGLYLLARDDLPPGVADAVGRHMPPGAWFDAARQYCSTYGRDHWGAHDPQDPGWPPPGSARRLLEAALPTLPEGPGLVVELGCAAGGVTHALAELTGAPVLGLDLSAPLVRLAQQALQRGRARYPLRQHGTAFAWRDLAVPPAAAPAEAWIADAMAPPLSPGCARLVVALNLLDCVAEPRALLAAIRRLLRPGGVAVLATPFDWSAAATPAAAWPGARALREAPATLPELIEEAGLVPLAPAQERDWTLRLHARAAMTYRASIATARVPLRSDAPSGPGRCATRAGANVAIGGRL